jgi:sigma-E factor negative regulatory protein RseC
MDSPQGRILSVHLHGPEARAVVEVEVAPRCARCVSGKGCGAGLSGGDSKRRQVDALILRGLDVRKGDTVRIELAPENLLQASLIAYGSPLGGALLGAVISWVAGFGDSGAAIAALIGATVGFLVGRSRLHKKSCLRRFTPAVTARLVPVDR